MFYGQSNDILGWYSRQLRQMVILQCKVQHNFILYSIFHTNCISKHITELNNTQQQTEDAIHFPKQ